MPNKLYAVVHERDITGNNEVSDLYFYPSKIEAKADFIAKLRVDQPFHAFYLVKINSSANKVMFFNKKVKIISRKPFRLEQDDLARLFQRGANQPFKLNEKLDVLKEFKPALLKNAGMAAESSGNSNSSASAPGFFQRIFGGPSVLEEEEICKFLGLGPFATLDQENKKFIVELKRFLPRNFMSNSPSEKKDVIYKLRLEQNFIKLLDAQPKMAARLIKKIVNNNQTFANEILNSRLGHLLQTHVQRALRQGAFNQLFAAAQPQASAPERRDLFQRAVLMLGHNGVRIVIRRPGDIFQMQRPANPPVIMPDIKATFRGEAIEKLDEQGIKFEIPDNLICPLSQSIFIDPVKVVQNIAGEAHTFYFEREFILEALKQKSENPINREPMKAADLQEAPEKKAEVEQFKQQMLQGEHGDKLREIIAALQAEPQTPGRKL